jgi:hypothetical protein
MLSREEKRKRFLKLIKRNEEIYSKIDDIINKGYNNEEIPNHLIISYYEKKFIELYSQDIYFKQLDLNHYIDEYFRINNIEFDYRDMNCKQIIDLIENNKKQIFNYTRDNYINERKKELENEIKNEESFLNYNDIDYEKIIMQSFKKGEQDRFGL